MTPDNIHDLLPHVWAVKTWNTNLEVFDNAAEFEARHSELMALGYPCLEWSAPAGVESR